MQLRYVLVAFIALLLCTTSVFAIGYSISRHTINSEVNADGGAQIVERFYLKFATDSDKFDFRVNSTQLGSNFIGWKQLNQRFAPSIGSDTIVNGKISYNEGTDSYLEISYELPDPLMAKGKDAALVTEFSLKVDYFNGYYQSGVWIIPDNTIITITLPPGAEIKNAIEPDGLITSNGSRKTITWEGYKSANRLTINYILWKKVAPVVDVNSLLTLLFKTTQGQILLLILAIAIVLVLWKKQFITDRIEKFVEENSKIEEE